MTAEVVWRNPLPPAKDGTSIERVTSDDCGAVYAVSKSDAQQNFELIMGGVAGHSPRSRARWVDLLPYLGM